MALVSSDAMRTAYDEQATPFPGSWDTDARVVLLGQSPRPATVLGLIIEIETREKG